MLLLQGAGRVNSAGSQMHCLDTASHCHLLRVPIRPGHKHHSGQKTQKHATHPTGHSVSLRRAVVDIQDKNGDDNGEGDEYHGEEEVLAN